MENNLSRTKSEEVLKSLKEIDTVDTIESIGNTKSPFYLYFENFMPSGGKSKNDNIRYSHGSIGYTFPVSVPFSKQYEFDQKYANAIQEEKLFVLMKKDPKFFICFLILILNSKKELIGMNL